MRLAFLTTLTALTACSGSGGIVSSEVTTVEIAPPPPASADPFPQAVEPRDPSPGSGVANQFKPPTPVLFLTASDKLAPGSELALEAVRAHLATRPDVTVLRIEGHSDNLGNASANLTLTAKRVLAVAHWLAQHGVDCKRLLPIAFGEKYPIAPNTTPEGRTQNRRIDFFDAAIRGRTMGGNHIYAGGSLAGDVCHP